MLLGNQLSIYSNNINSSTMKKETAISIPRTTPFTFVTILPFIIPPISQRMSIIKTDIWLIRAGINRSPTLLVSSLRHILVLL